VGQFDAALNLDCDWQAGNFIFSPIVGVQYSYAESLASPKAEQTVSILTWFSRM
jgi:hypothetical protein